MTRSPSATLFFGILALALAATPSPASGQILRFVDSLIDSPLGVNVAVATSPDGRHVYAVSSNDVLSGGAVVLFTRDEGSGALEFVGAQTQGKDGADGIEEPLALALGPDGSNLYVVGITRHEGSLAVFDRDPATGALTFVEAHYNDDGGVQGLGLPTGVIVSPDDRHVYVTSRSTPSGVAVFARDESTGALSFVEALLDDTAGVDGLRGANDLAMSPDGRSIYVATLLDDSVTAFARDPATGTLSFVEAHFNGLAGVEGLETATAVSVSPDGRNVYVASFGAVAVFARDLGSGALGFLGTCCETDDSEFFTTTVEVSPDGDSVYTLFRDSPNALQVYKLAVLARDGETGTLELAESHQVADFGGSASLSPDGRHLYAATGNAVTVYERAAGTDTLELIEVQSGGEDGVEGLRGARDAAVSPDGRHLYVAAHEDSAVSALARDPATGELSFVEARFQSQDDVEGRWGVEGLALSPDGRHLYAASSNSGGGVAAFERDPESGALRFLEANVDGGPEGAPGEPLALSHDGRHLYASSGDRVAVYERDAASGTLHFVEAPPTSEVTGRVQSQVLSRDGRHLYAVVSSCCFQGCGLVVVYERDAASGQLDFVEEHFIPGCMVPYDIVLSPDDRHVYGTGAGAAAVGDVGARFDHRRAECDRRDRGLPDHLVGGEPGRTPSLRHRRRLPCLSRRRDVEGIPTGSQHRRAEFSRRLGRRPGRRQRPFQCQGG